MNQFSQIQYRQPMHEQQTQDTQPIGATVFVVDDDAAVRRSLTRLLRAGGWNVEALASANELLQRAPFTGTGCILLDVQMPGMNGLELHERLSEAGFSLPVVFLSGNGDIPMSVRAMKHGAVDFLVKPVAEDVLFQALDQAIARHLAEMTAQHSRDVILARLVQLSQREREVLEQVVQGRLNKQIAFDLGIAEKTVKVHRGRVMEKMEASSLAELVHMCDAVDITSPEAAD
jgi:FixJ family two-component response regulator